MLPRRLRLQERNFHLYIIQLWLPIFHILTHADIVDAQTWEVFPLKNPVGPPLEEYKGYHKVLMTSQQKCRPPELMSCIIR